MQMQKNDIHEEQLLIRYLLGSLPEDKAEPLDALSVSDDDFSARLSAVEHDLVDAYVRGELRGDTLSRFESWYLSSPARQQRVAFARALLAIPRRDAAAYQSDDLSRDAGYATSHRRGLPSWALLAAALAVILTSGYLLVANFGASDEVILTDGTPAFVEPATSPAPALATRTPQARSASPEAAPTVLPPPLLREAQTVAVSVLLRPQTRSIASLPAVTIAPDADIVIARLQLEFDDFPRYEVALKGPASDHILWRSETLLAVSEEERRVVPVQLPAALLRPGNYSLELGGKPTDDTGSELIGNYVFRAVLE